MTGVDTLLARAEAALMAACDAESAERRRGVGDVIDAIRAELLDGPAAGPYVTLLRRLDDETPEWRAGAELASAAILGVVRAILARRAEAGR